MNGEISSICAELIVRFSSGRRNVGVVVAVASLLAVIYDNAALAEAASSPTRHTRASSVADTTASRKVWFQDGNSLRSRPGVELVDRASRVLSESSVRRSSVDVNIEAAILATTTQQQPTTTADLRTTSVSRRSLRQWEVDSSKTWCRYLTAIEKKDLLSQQCPDDCTAMGLKILLPVMEMCSPTDSAKEGCFMSSMACSSYPGATTVPCAYGDSCPCAALDAAAATASGCATTATTTPTAAPQAAPAPPSSSSPGSTISPMPSPASETWDNYHSDVDVNLSYDPDIVSSEESMPTDDDDVPGGGDDEPLAPPPTEAGGGGDDPHALFSETTEGTIAEGPSLSEEPLDEVPNDSQSDADPSIQAADKTNSTAVLQLQPSIGALLKNTYRDNAETILLAGCGGTVALTCAGMVVAWGVWRRRRDARKAERNRQMAEEWTSQGNMIVNPVAEAYATAHVYRSSVLGRLLGRESAVASTAERRPSRRFSLSSFFITSQRNDPEPMDFPSILPYETGAKQLMMSRPPRADSDRDSDDDVDNEDKHKSTTTSPTRVILQLHDSHGSSTPEIDLCARLAAPERSVKASNPFAEAAEEEEERRVAASGRPSAHRARGSAGANGCGRHEAAASQTHPASQPKLTPIPRKTAPRLQSNPPESPPDEPPPPPAVSLAAASSRRKADTAAGMPKASSRTTQPPAAGARKRPHHAPSPPPPPPPPAGPPRPGGSQSPSPTPLGGAARRPHQAPPPPPLPPKRPAGSSQSQLNEVLVSSSSAGDEAKTLRQKHAAAIKSSPPPVPLPSYRQPVAPAEAQALSSAAHHHRGKEQRPDPSPANPMPIKPAGLKNSSASVKAKPSGKAQRVPPAAPPLPPPPPGGRAAARGRLP